MRDTDCGSIHKKCFEEYVKKALKDKNIPLKCPVDGCKKYLTKVHVEELNVLEEAMAYLNSSEMPINGHIVASCPSEGCRNLVRVTE